MALKLTKNEIIERFQKIHNYKYDYSSVEYVNQYIKIKIICPVHGKFEQRPKNHFNGAGCSKCYTKSISFTTEDFIQKANKIWNKKYDYSLVDYINFKVKVKIICPVHGEFEQFPNGHLSGKYGCKKCYWDSKKELNLIDEFRKIHGNKFDYSNSIIINDKVKIEIICPLHGSFYQTPHVHKKSKYACPICRNNNASLTTEEFIKNAKNVHKNRYDYSKTKYVNSDTKVTIICNDHGEFQVLPGNHVSLKQNCPKCGITISNFHLEMSSLFNNPILNDKTTIYPSELDIYLPNQKLAIECNGNYWHSELQGKGKSYHLNKTKECEIRNIQLLHILESEWIQKSDIWKSIIYSKLGLNKRIYARKCEIREVENKEKNNFLNENHLQGEDKSSVKLGLYYDNTLVSLMTFIKSRFNKNYEWEISRFVSKIGYSIIGGASKLLSYFKKNYNPISIITYADRRYSTGNLYKMLGFKFSHYSDPNYFYTKDYIECKSRIQFQKHKLKDILQMFDESLTEWENMKNNGYDRIWDCGNSVWVWN